MTQIKFRKCLQLACLALVDARNPGDAKRSVKWSLALTSAGPKYRWHLNQYEKLWNMEFWIYGIRHRHPKHILAYIALKNENQSSTFTCFDAALYHNRKIHPFETQFDARTEAVELQEFMWKFGGKGEDSVACGTSKQNAVVEVSWQEFHEKYIWPLRIEFAHLAMMWQTDCLNPVHLFVACAFYAPQIQGAMDRFASLKNKKDMSLFVICCPHPPK